MATSSFDKEFILTEKELEKLAKQNNLTTDELLESFGVEFVIPKENEHVYCTQCINFEENLKCLSYDCFLEGHNKKYCKTCSCNGCDCGDLEDSTPFSERPNYIPIN